MVNEALSEDWKQQDVNSSNGPAAKLLRWSVWKIPLSLLTLMDDLEEADFATSLILSTRRWLGTHT